MALVSKPSESNLLIRFPAIGVSDNRGGGGKVRTAEDVEDESVLIEDDEVLMVRPGALLIRRTGVDGIGISEANGDVLEFDVSDVGDKP